MVVEKGNNLNLVYAHKTPTSSLHDPKKAQGKYLTRKKMQK